MKCERVAHPVCCAVLHRNVCVCWVLAAADYATQVTSFLIRNQRTVDAVGPGKERCFRDLPSKRRNFRVQQLPLG